MSANSGDVGQEKFDDISNIIQSIKENEITRIALENKKISSAQFNELCEAIQENGGVWSISLNNCGVNTDRLKNLCERIKNNKNLKTLHLYENEISSGDIKYLIDILPGLESLKTLHLEENEISIQGIQMITEVLPQTHISEIYLNQQTSGSRNALIIYESASLLESLKKAPEVTKFRIDGNSKVDEAIATFFEARDKERKQDEDVNKEAQAFFKELGLPDNPVRTVLTQYMTGQTPVTRKSKTPKIESESQLKGKSPRPGGGKDKE